MIYFHITYRGQTTKEKMPSSWDEMTVKNFIDLEGSKGNTANPTELLSILSGVPLPKIMDTRTNLQIQIDEALNFITFNPPNWKELSLRDRYKFKSIDYHVPNGINFIQKIVRFFLGLFKYKFHMRPNDLELETFGQKIMLQNKLNATDNPIEVIAYAIAIYMQKVIDGRFDEKRAEILEKEVMQMRITEVYPLAIFFFHQLIKFKRFGVKGLLQFL